MPYSDLTELNVYEFGNKTDVDAFTTEIDNRFKVSATVTEHTATSTTPEGGTPVVYAFFTPVAAGTISLTMPARFRFAGITASRVAAAGGASTLQVFNAGNAITDAIDCNKAIKLMVDPVASIDALYSRVSAGALLSVTTVGANNSMMVTITGYHT